MTTVRVVCTRSPSCGTVVDFALADNAENSIITHDNLLKLRQHQTPDAESILPPLVLRDDNRQIDISFDKPEKASPEEQQKLTEVRPLILASYNRFKHRGENSTLKITEETLALAYSFINPYEMEVKSPADEKLKKDLINSQRRLRTYSKKKSFRGD